MFWHSQLPPLIPQAPQHVFRRSVSRLGSLDVDLKVLPLASQMPSTGPLANRSAANKPCSVLHLHPFTAFCSQASPLSLIVLVLLMPCVVVLVVVTVPMLIPSGLLDVLMRLKLVTLHAFHRSSGLQRVLQAQQRQITRPKTTTTC